MFKITSNILAMLPLLPFMLSENRFNLPNDFVKCDAKNSNFSQCVTSTIEKLATMIIKGIPALNISPLEPVHLDSAVFQASPGSPLNVRLELKNITFYGFANVTIISFEGTDLEKNVIQVIGRLPRAKVTANYIIEGRMLYLPLKSRGTTVINMNNLKIKIRCQNQLQIRNKKLYSVVRNITVDTEVESGNIFRKSTEKVNILGAFFFIFLLKDGLSDNEFSQVMNDNFLVMFNEYRPVINDLFIKLIRPRLTIFNNEIPLETIFTSI